MFDKLYDVLEKKSDFLLLKFSDENHPIFQAHFPNNHILPGFVLLEICEKELNLKIHELKKISFFANIKPDEIIKFSWQNKDKNYQFKIQKDQEILASFNIIVF